MLVFFRQASEVGAEIDNRLVRGGHLLLQALILLYETCISGRQSSQIKTLVDFSRMFELCRMLASGLSSSKQTTGSAITI